MFIFEIEFSKFWKRRARNLNNLKFLPNFYHNFFLFFDIQISDFLKKRARGSDKQKINLDCPTVGNTKKNKNVNLFLKIFHTQSNITSRAFREPICLKHSQSSYWCLHRNDRVKSSNKSGSKMTLFVLLLYIFIVQSYGLILWFPIIITSLRFNYRCVTLTMFQLKSLWYVF